MTIICHHCGKQVAVWMTGHRQDAGMAAHPGFENCDDANHYAALSVGEHWSSKPGDPFVQYGVRCTGSREAL